MNQTSPSMTIANVANDRDKAINVSEEWLVAQLDLAIAALDDAFTVSETALLRDGFVIGEHLSQRRRFSRAARVATEGRIRAGRRLGEQIPREFPPGGDPTLPRVRLADHGISFKASNRFQALARLSDIDFEEILRAVDEQDEGELSEIAVLRMANMQVHFSGDAEEWYTPPEIIERVIQTMGHIDLDPCSNSKDNPSVPAHQHFTAEDNGLSQHWFGQVYMNPPYGDEIVEWIDKLSEEFAAGHVVEAIALVPARTDTAWFRSIGAGYFCFIAGRLRFSDHANAAPFPSVCAYLGENPEAFATAFGDIGDIYRRLAEGEMVEW